MNAKKHVLLGGFLLISIALLTLVSLKLRGALLGPRTAWTVYFGEDSVIEEGYDVWSSGIKVGVIDKVEAVPDAEFSKIRQVKATVLVREKFTVWRDGELVLSSRGFLGGYRAVLHRGTPATGERPNTEPLPGRVETDAIRQLKQVVDDNRASVKGITKDVAEVVSAINRGEGNVGRLLREDKLYKDFAAMVANLKRFSEWVTDEDSAMVRFVRDKELHDNVTGLIRSGRSIADKIDKGEGFVGRLINDKALITRLEEGINKLADLATDIQSGKGTLGLLLKDEATAEHVAASLKAVREFVDALNDRKGSIGQFVYDRAIYDDIQAVTGKLRSIAERIDNGEGTLGKFLKNDGIYNELQRMLESFRESGDIARENAAMGSLTSFASLFFNTFN